jgi:glycine/D-amino acid oxidase-like deaminating enzyme
MIQRYNNPSTAPKTLPDGQSVRIMKPFQSIPKSDDDIYIRTEEGGRIDLLAMEFYGDPTLWWIIAIANNINSADIGVDGGVQLRIPRDIEYINDLVKL